MTNEPLSDDAGRGFFYTFAEKTDSVMVLFLAISVLGITASVISLIIVKSIRNENPGNKVKIRIALSLMIATLVMVLSDLLFCGHSLEYSIPFDMAVSLLPMLIVTFSVWEKEISFNLVGYLALPMVLMTLWYILQGVGMLPQITGKYYVPMTGTVTVVICLIFISALIMRTMQVRQVLRNGNTWSSVCLMVDVMYLIVMVVLVMIYLVSTLVCPSFSHLVSYFVAFLLTCELAALGLRLSLDSLFLVWRSHERRIVESMKISHTDVASESTKVSEVYHDIYSRLVTLFETEKIYLDSELTINDVGKVIFTNKLYISRAISKFTGRNFCQFVNYYRISHSVQLFRENPDLKVVELANQSGFNSTVSYSMAFRLYMSESPSDWCRKEKLKLVRRKK